MEFYVAYMFYDLNRAFFFSKQVLDIRMGFHITGREEKSDMSLGSNGIPPRELAFDIDGVVADTFRIFIETASKNYGVHIDYESVTEYNFWEILGLDEKMCGEIIQGILDHPLEMGIRPIPGAVEVLTRLSEITPLLFVTARPDRVSIINWIQQELGIRDTGRIRLEATGTHLEKLPVIIEYGARYFVEDRLETCYLLDQGPVIPIVFEQPWNRKPHPFQTVKNWDELSAMIAW